MSRFDKASRKALQTPFWVAGLTGLLGACGGGGSRGGPPPPTSFGNATPPSSGPEITSMDRILLTGQPAGSIKWRTAR